MKQALYLQQGKEPNGSLFLARDPGGGLLYRLDGPRDSLTLHSRFLLLDSAGRHRARILRVGLTDMSVYELRLDTGQRLRVVRQHATRKGGLLFQGKNWRFRGSLETRCFDIVENSRVRMTHAPCWQGECGFCYGLTLDGEEPDHLFCLCAAMIADSAAVLPGRCPLPV